MGSEFNNKWNPSKKDVQAVCEAIEDGFYEDGNDYCDDSCRYCGTEYKFYRGGIADKHPERLPHETNCAVLKARDILTGINK